MLIQNALVLVMGSKEEDVPAVPVEPTRFVEDMNESELATAVSILYSFICNTTCATNQISVCNYPLTKQINILVYI